MNGRVIEIASDNMDLSLHRGFMIVASQAGQEQGRIAIDDMLALVVRGYGSRISLSLCARLAEAGIPVVLCDRSQSLASLVWPISGHYEQGRRMQAQAEASRPTRKRIWRDLVIAKITAQVGVLSHVGQHSTRLSMLARSVKSGDPENCEAQAARAYWPLLLGNDFRRDRGQPGPNALLNYGYTVLRAAAARSILAAGLHPSLSVHHESRGDALRLADDLMEPFRPYVDLTVKRWMEKSGDALDPAAKAALVSVLTLDLEGPRGARPLQTCLDALATSLAQVFMGDARTLDLPNGPIPLSLHAP